MAAGLAGDVVTATCLATTAPVVVAPAMDGDMYAHPATQANVARLRAAFGYAIVEPEFGPLASGQSGIGRLAATEAVVEAVVVAVAGRPLRSPDPASRPPAAELPREADLAGRHVVVTAGGTAEPIDPVRFITNRSSGRMGAAVAEAALDRGARVTLIAGTVTVELPDRATVIQVGSTAQMRAALLAATGADAAGRAGFDALVMAAAVADFRPTRPAETKLARGNASPWSSSPRQTSWPRSAGSSEVSTRPALRPAAHTTRRRCSLVSRPRRARWTVPRRSSAARGSTCSWPTTWRSRARASGRRRTG